MAERTVNTSRTRAKSDQLMEIAGSTLNRAPSADAVVSMVTEDLGASLSRKPNFAGKRIHGASPGRKAGHHIRKARSAQLAKPDNLEDIASSGAQLSRASSASLGFSFSFAGYGATPEHIDVADLEPFKSDEENQVDIETPRKTIAMNPTMPIDVKFTDVKYRVVFGAVARSSEKEILSGITGWASAGEIVALMGPSGSGKTTLLSLLSGRAVGNGNLYGGIITYNDSPFTKPLKRRIGFVSQDDILFPHITVKETLTYVARLRLPRTLTRLQKKERALEVIHALGLERCQDTMIGGHFVRGVSGGERKRVCIGNEIIINPSLLFLDEPTSGLDSTTALRIVQILQDIARAGKTVVTTIHQPSSRMFRRFDNLLLLSKGSQLYFGKASEVMTYFSSVGCSPLIVMNPAEFLLDLANGNLSDISVPSELDGMVQAAGLRSGNEKGVMKPTPKNVHEYLVQAYETRLAEEETGKLRTPPIPTSGDQLEKVHASSNLQREWGASWSEQFRILFCRGIKERRHDYLSWTRITQVIATAFVLGLLWWHSDSGTASGLHDQAGLLFFIAVFWGFLPVFTAIFTFPHERAMLNKERAVDMYRLSAYFMARTTSDLPLDLFLPVIFIAIVYLMAGLKLSAASFFLTLLTVFLSIIAAQGLGLVIGACLIDIKKATTLASVTVMTFMLAGGFFVKRVPPFISWIRYASFNYHTYELLLRVQYGNTPVFQNAIDTADGGVKAVCAMVVMTVGYRLLAYIALRRKMFPAGAAA